MFCIWIFSTLWDFFRTFLDWTKGSPFNFALWRMFKKPNLSIFVLFGKCFNVAKGFPFPVFWYFAANWNFKKPKWSHLSTFFGPMRLFQNSHFSFFFEIFSKSFEVFNVTLHFFDILSQTGVFQKSKRVPPLQFLKRCVFSALDLAPTFALPGLLYHSLFFQIASFVSYSLISRFWCNLFSQVPNSW